MAKTLRRVSVLFAFLSFLSFVLPRITVAANNPVPVINDPLVPSAVAPGGPTFTLTVNGSNFVAASVVKLNGVALATTFVNSSQLTATVPNTAIATAGSASITVTNPAPVGGTSLPAYLRVATPVTTPSFVSYIQGTGFGGFFGVYAPLTGDFNGDGKLDLAFLGQNGSTSTPSYAVCIALGNGNGSFQSPVCQQATGSRYFASLVTGDFNSDGKLDLAVANNPNPTGNGFVSLFVGNGDGTLKSSIDSPSGNGPVILGAGDFNRDGKLDIAVVNFIQGSTNTTFITVLLGDGDGAFQAPVTYAFGLNAFSLAVGDFNRDGSLDLVFNSGDGAGPNTVYFMAGNGDGTFQTPQAGQVLAEFDNVTSAVDLNGDDKLDLLLRDNDGNNAVLLGNGDGTFQGKSPISSPNDPDICGAAAVDDINADGKLDLTFCVGNVSNTSEVQFQLGNGDGTFGTVTNLSTPPASVAFPKGIITGDFNGDGRVDLVTSMAILSPGEPSALLVYLQGSFPVVSPSMTSLDFSQQAVGFPSSPQTITLTNSGTISVTVSGVSFTGANAASFGQTNNCGALVGGASCAINVTFDPSIAGNAVAVMNIASNAVNNPSTISLTGSTQGPAATLSPTSVTFPNQYVGTSGNPQSVTVTNNGTATLTITNVAASPSDFATLNACGSSLAVGASCAIGVFFDPTTGGTRTGTLTITDNAGDPQTVPLTGTGQDFSMSAGSSSSATISAGQTANYSISLAPAGGFAQTVALTCSGGPTGSNCAVSPATIALGGTAAQTVKVTVTTPAQGAIPSIIRWRGERNRLAPLTFALAQSFLVFILGSLLVTFSRRNQGMRSAPLFAAALVVSMSLALASCGGGSGNSGGGGNTNPESGTYTVNVSGNFSTGSTTLTHNTKLTLVVH